MATLLALHLFHLSTLSIPHPMILPDLSLVRPLQPLIPLDLVLPLPPPITSDLRPFLAFSLLLLIHFHNPRIFALLVVALVAPSWNPFTRRLVVHELLLLFFALRLDALLRGEFLPCRLCFWWW